MSYVVMARKWRPLVFEDVIAQSHVTVTLQNAVRAGRTAHAYLFSGPRGSGKTTTARILAKALNCDQGPTPTPCNRCRACESINRGTSPDVLEIDAASNRGIDEIRSLREKVIIGVSKQSGHKVYIIDEVHMLTQEAFNALLKTLEEPPAHVIFILATTERHRVPATILSRCQHFPFRRIPSEDIVRQLAHIARQEGIEIPEEALFLIARRADGAMRDAQSVLDQVVAFAGTSITEEAVREALGILDQDLFFRVTDAALERDRVAGLNLIEELTGQGGDVGEFARGLLEHLRNLLVCKIQGGGRSLDLSEADRLRYQACGERFSEQDLQRMIQMVADLDRDIGDAIQPRFYLEIAILKLIAMEPAVLIEDLLDRLGRLEERLKGGLSPVAASPSRPAQESVPAPPSPLPGRIQRPERDISNPTAQEMESPGRPNRSGEDTPARAESPGRTSRNGEDASAQAEQDAPAKDSAPPPAPAVLSGPVSLETVRQKWDEIVGRVKTITISLGAHLDTGTPCALEEEMLQIRFPARAAFSANHIKRKKKVLEDIAAEVLGTRLRVDCILEGSDAEPQPSPDPGGQQEAEQQEAEVAPSVQTVLQIFDGEILRR
ncbi:MAG: DNA polymerase III subunit gamma/tau [Candidatus Latescibacteria bacterium]|nr:DNA polymerase III subunit gamma/tau [Candidatus Latescibacterota bacterium]